MKNNPLFIVTLILSLIIPHVAAAQDHQYSLNPDAEGVDIVKNLPSSPSPAKGEVSVGEAVSPMKKGQTAPFTGLLLSPDAIAKIIAEFEYKQQEIDIEINRAVDELNVKHEHEMTIERIKSESDARSSQDRINSQKKEIDRLDSELKKEKEDRPNPVVWASLGAAAGVILSTLTAATIVYVYKH